MIYDCFMKTPLGFGSRYIHICASDKGITNISFVSHKHDLSNPNDLTSLCTQALSEYFNGHKTSFDLPLDLEGSPFQKRVWQTLREIKFGEVLSYRDLALRVGGVNYSRAVGGANSKNPILIVIPCHRVIAHNGNLGGYSAGLEIKKWLLAHEGIKI